MALRSPQPGRRVVLFGSTTNRDATTVADILRRETVGGVLMLVSALAALIWANVSFATYDAVRHVPLGPLDLQHWAADGLLAIFFFVAGIELRRELTSGSLARPAEALVPVAAAIGGMLIPALIYLGVNLTLPGGRPEGWATPMATDIAFALAVLAVVGRALPASLRAFLLTLAIVDDLGAILVIAVVFTSDLRFTWLAAAAGCAALFALLQSRRVEAWFLYLPLAVACWGFMYASGVHATIAGVALGLLVRSSATDPNAPAERWQHRWQPISAGVAVPLFALLSAGVAVSPSLLGQLLTAPPAVGIVLGLVVGKTVGVFAGAYLTARFTRAELAPDLRWSEVASVSLLAGVGFTVALLIAELAFVSDVATQDQAKAAVLLGSLLSGGLAAVSLRRRSAERRAGHRTAGSGH